MRRVTSSAVSLIVVFVLGTMFITDFVTPVIAAQQERPLAIVRRFKPTVELASLNKQTFELNLTENIGEKLFSGDTLSTNEDGYALVIFMDNTIAKVKPQSSLIVSGEEKPDSRNTNRRIDLDRGEIFLEVEPQGSGSFDVATSRSLASVKGTSFGSTAFGYVWVEEGQVDVTATTSGQTVSLFQQMYATVDVSGNNIESGTLTQEEIESLQDGYEELDEDLIEKTIIIRFRDVNGQVREIPITIFEKGN